MMKIHSNLLKVLVNLPLKILKIYDINILQIISRAPNGGGDAHAGYFMTCTRYLQKAPASMLLKFREKLTVNQITPL